MPMGPVEKIPSEKNDNFIVTRRTTRDVIAVQTVREADRISLKERKISAKENGDLVSFNHYVKVSPPVAGIGRNEK